MKLVKVLAIVGIGLSFGLQTEWRETLLAKYDAFVETWAQVKLPTIPAELTSLVGQSATQ